MFQPVCQIRVEVQWTNEQVHKIQRTMVEKCPHILDVRPQPRVPFVCLDQEHGRHIYIEFLLPDAKRVRQDLLAIKTGIVQIGPIIQTGRYM